MSALRAEIVSGRVMNEQERREVVKLLQDLLRFDTTNPPGNETPAAGFLKELFDKEGIPCEVLESQPGRGSFLASMDGTSSKPSLLLLSHLDVVPATDPQSWKHPPFSGELDNGWVYGRGAIDTKFLTAAQAMAMILLKREGVKLRGTLKMASVADEEKGGTYGAQWLAEKHPEKIRAEYVINEGGGGILRTRSHPLYLLEAEEKGVCLVKVTSKGVAGHASMPDLGVSAVTTMAKVLSKIADHKTQIAPSPTLKKMFEALDEYGFFAGLPHKTLLDSRTTDQVLDKIRGHDPAIAAAISALLRPTIAETMVKGGVKENVIPDYCEAIIDCRLPQGVTKDDMLSELRDVAGAVKGVEFEAIEYRPASASPTDNQFYKTILGALKTTVGEEAELVPSVVPGTSDSSYLRPLGSVAYGFAPTSPDVDIRQLMGLIHGLDERINVESLYTCTNFLDNLCRTVLSQLSNMAA